MRGLRPPITVVVACALASLVATGSALANQIKKNPADQAAAKHAVLRPSDLPTIATWKRIANISGGGSGSS